jgi:hypothetical protein
MTTPSAVAKTGSAKMPDEGLSLLVLMAGLIFWGTSGHPLSAVVTAVGLVVAGVAAHRHSPDVLERVVRKLDVLVAIGFVVLLVLAYGPLLYKPLAPIVQRVFTIKGLLLIVIWCLLSLGAKVGRVGQLLAEWDVREREDRQRDDKFLTSMERIRRRQIVRHRRAASE